MDRPRSTARVTTKSGDSGYTSIVGPGRVPKYDPRVEALGDVDEANSSLGIARASVEDPRVREIILGLQQDLGVVMAELAMAPDAKAKLRRRIERSAVERIEVLQADLFEEANVPPLFIVPGATQTGAALDLARTIVRRAERKIAHLTHDQAIANPEILRYMNRLSDVVFVLARYVERDVKPVLSQTQPLVERSST